MFFRRADFLSVGGMDPGTMVMEEADLCVRMTPLGRIRMVSRIGPTSDRRAARWGEIKANWVCLKAGVSAGAWAGGGGRSRIIPMSVSSRALRRAPKEREFAQ